MHDVHFVQDGRSGCDRGHERDRWRQKLRGEKVRCSKLGGGALGIVVPPAQRRSRQQDGACHEPEQAQIGRGPGGACLWIAIMIPLQPPCRRLQGIETRGKRIG